MLGSIRLFVTSPLTAGAEVELDHAQAHYLVHVMRRRVGAEIVLWNGRDGAWQARISVLRAGNTRALVHDQLCAQRPEPGPWLAFAHVKRPACELIVQKATELGAERLLLCRTERSLVTAPNAARLVAIATEAAEQSERLTRPEIAPSRALPDLLATWPAERTLFAAIERRPLPSPGDATPCGLLIGPEGGFTERELDLLARTPFVRLVSLGPRILRAETAAIAGLACIAASAGSPI